MKRYRLELKFIDLRKELINAINLYFHDTEYSTDIIDQILDLTGFENKSRIKFVEANSLLEACQKIDRNIYQIVSCMEFK